MSPLKRFVVAVVKAIAGIAAVVALLCPFGSWTQVLTFMGSVVALLISYFLLINLDDNYFGKDSDGYWPAKPIDWGPRLDQHDAGEKREHG
jgi:hypothetical protein